MVGLEGYMREIKFRAWVDTYSRWHMTTSFALSADGSFFNGGIYSMSKPEWKLLQYTGLKDKNGREIYEGDVLKDRGDEGPVYVEWSQEYGGFVFVDKFDPSGIVLYSPREIYYEQFAVIGNIYENPELLEVPNGKGES